MVLSRHVFDKGIVRRWGRRSAVKKNAMALRDAIAAEAEEHMHAHAAPSAADDADCTCSIGNDHDGDFASLPEAVYRDDGLKSGPQGCNSIDILGLAQFRAQNPVQNVAQVLSDRNTGILDLALLGPAPIQSAQFCGPVSSPVDV